MTNDQETIGQQPAGRIHRAWARVNCTPSETARVYVGQYLPGGSWFVDHYVDDDAEPGDSYDGLDEQAAYEKAAEIRAVGEWIEGREVKRETGTITIPVHD